MLYWRTSYKALKDGQINYASLLRQKSFVKLDLGGKARIDTDLFVQSIKPRIRYWESALKPKTP